MEFTLYYRGDLKSRAGPEEKHALRRHFSAQLIHLWEQKAIYGRFGGSGAFPALTGTNFVREVGACRFAAMVTRGNVAELDVIMLRPDLPGAIISHGGDLDNRLKTLLDSLRMPAAAEELPRDAKPTSDEEVILCPLEDDRFLTKVSVTSLQLLEPNVAPATVVLVLNMRTRHISEFEAKVGMLDGPGILA